MTHMHFDHAAGLTDQAGHAIFENAIHVLRQDQSGMSLLHLI